METDYLTHDQACTFLDACARNTTFAYGIERFLQDGQGHRPDIYGIADWSDLEPTQITDSLAASRSYLMSYGRDSSELFVIVYQAP